ILINLPLLQSIVTSIAARGILSEKEIVDSIATRNISTEPEEEQESDTDIDEQEDTNKQKIASKEAIERINDLKNFFFLKKTKILIRIFVINLLFNMASFQKEEALSSQKKNFKYYKRPKNSR
ncbi:unnamed protein product, partial [Brachionus calyciflorus]